MISVREDTNRGNKLRFVETGTEALEKVQKNTVQRVLEKVNQGLFSYSNQSQ